jgi:hypothetical protein
LITSSRRPPTTISSGAASSEISRMPASAAMPRRLSGSALLPTY